MDWPRKSGAQAGSSSLREPVTRSIELAMIPELACMTRFLGRTTRNKTLASIRFRLRGLLDTLEALIVEGEIHPWQGLRLSEEDAPYVGPDRPLRLGVYPIQANPLHWGHIFNGLSAMAEARLDKVVYVVVDGARDQRGLLSEELRHCTACGLLRSFDPLLCYSPVARDSCSDAESSVFHLLALNPGRKIDAFYIGDAQEALRENPATGKPRLIEKLENGVLRHIYRDGEHAGGAHSLSLILLTAGGIEVVPDTFLALRFIASPKPDITIADARSTIMGDRKTEVLAALPYSVFRQIQGASI
jgi:hypothetical protein